MRWRLSLAALLLPLAASGASPSAAYSRGVDAYQARDYARARIAFSAAVKQNETAAFNDLGFLMFYGMGGKKDTKGAVALWRKAASRGHTEAQRQLGSAYEAGEGTSRSLVQAYVWLTCSMRNGDAATEDREYQERLADAARKALAPVKAALSEEQIASADTFVRGCLVKKAVR